MSIRELGERWQSLWLARGDDPSHEQEHEWDAAMDALLAFIQAELPEELEVFIDFKEDRCVLITREEYDEIYGLPA